MRAVQSCAAILACAVAGGSMASNARAAEPRATNLNELVILAPKGHERGLPPVNVANGQVDLPPTLHIHRYYYSGDKDYQGPVIAGGKTIVVASHPATGKRTYTEVMLPDGAPVIAYSDHSITYVYPQRRVRLAYSRLWPDTVKVAYLPGRGFGRNLRDASTTLVQRVKDYDEKSPLNREVKETVRTGVNVGKGAFMVVQGTYSTVLGKAREVATFLPGVRMLEGLGKQAEERAEVERIRQSGMVRDRTDKANDFLKTLR